MRPRRPVVHHGAVELSSGSLYQARPALQSIPRLAPRKGRHQVKEPCVRFDSGSQKRGATPYAAGVRPFT